MDKIITTRVLKRRHVLALAFGAMVGWSWVLLTGVWIERAGVAGAVLAFLLAGLAMVLIALTYAELAAALPHLGGEHVYTQRAFGKRVSFICTWSLLLGYMSVVAFEAVALPYALSYLFPALNHGLLWTVAGYQVWLSQVVIGIVAAVLLTLVNSRGVSSAAGLQAGVTVLVVLSGLVLIVGVPSAGVLNHFTPLFSHGWSGVLSVIVMVPLMFVGFDVIPQAAAEIDLPARGIGRLVVVSVFCGVLWYVSIIVAVALLLDPAARSQAELTTAAAAQRAWGGKWAATALVCGGIAGIVTTWNAFLVGASRLMFALADSGALPAWLLGEHRDDHHSADFKRILWLLCALSCLAPWFGRPALVWLINAGSLGVIIAYALVALAFLKLRRSEPELVRPYRVPAGEAVGVLALILALLIGALYLPFSPSALRWPQEWLICGVWALLGAVFFVSAGGTQAGARR